MRFVLPHHVGMRPVWLLRLGLFLYDHIGGRKLLAKPRTLDIRSDPAGKPLKPIFRRAFEYSDCCVDDARLVVLNARGAADRGAAIHTRTAVTSARREGMHWHVGLQNLRNGKRWDVRARLLVNAAGPWVDEVLANAMGRNGVHNVRLVQGSHLVIRRRFEHGRAYFLQNADGRIIFAIPYGGEFTLIGTTDLDYSGDPRAAEIGDSEIAYLIEAANEYFLDPVRQEEIVWSFSGVRPLFDDGATKAQEATRGTPALMLTARGFSVTYLNGFMDMEQRRRVQQEFAGEVRVLATRAGALLMQLVFATLIIAAASAPLLLLGGTTGAFYRELATAYLIAVVAATTFVSEARS
jgi:glycerol-3-phosphate dehydrogenase